MALREEEEGEGDQWRREKETRHITVALEEDDQCRKEARRAVGAHRRGE